MERNKVDRYVGTGQEGSRQEAVDTGQVGSGQIDSELVGSG